MSKDFFSGLCLDGKSMVKYVMGTFEWVTWKNPPTNTHQIIKFKISMQVCRVIKKEFYCGVTKISCVIILTSKWCILIINWFRNGHITVIFSPVPYPDFSHSQIDTIASNNGYNRKMPYAK